MAEQINEEIMRAWPRDVVGRSLFRLAYVLALAGGVLMCAVGLMVVVSIVGRALFSKPIYGDFELVAMGTAISVFLFLPYCHLTKNNVIVDLFLARAPERLRTFFDSVGSLLFGVIAAVLTWRSVLGGIDMHEYNETSMILSIPVWIAFPFIVFSLGVLSICCLYTAMKDLRRVVQ